MPFDVEPLSPDLPFGVTIRGLRRAHLEDGQVREQLHHHWIQDGLVVFRDGDCDEVFHIALSKIFGPLELHPIREIQSRENPELVNISGAADKSVTAEVEGETGTGYIGWHKDLMYVDQINHGGILRALRPTSRGGITGYLDQITAYDRLPERLKDRIETLSIVYRLAPYDRFKYGARQPIRLIDISPPIQGLYARLDTDFPPVAHPMVFVQQETGRKVLNISPFFAMYIEGQENAEGDALLAELMAHIRDCPSYHHKWSTEELILWDNWRMVHMVTPIPLDEDRLLQRTTIKGDYGVGRKLTLAGSARHAH